MEGTLGVIRASGAGASTDSALMEAVRTTRVQSCRCATIRQGCYEDVHTVHRRRWRESLELSRKVGGDQACERGGGLVFVDALSGEFNLVLRFDP